MQYATAQCSTRLIPLLGSRTCPVSHKLLIAFALLRHSRVDGATYVSSHYCITCVQLRLHHLCSELHIMNNPIMTQKGLKGLNSYHAHLCVQSRLHHSPSSRPINQALNAATPRSLNASGITHFSLLNVRIASLLLKDG